MNNLLSDCGLVDTRISASKKDLPVLLAPQIFIPSDDLDLSIISNLTLSNIYPKILFFSNETVSDDPLRSPLWILVVNIVAMEMLRSKLPPGM